MDISIIIPTYTADNHLDICLLSILGQVQIDKVEIVCAPVAETSADERLKSWQKRDSRVVVASPSKDLFEALLQGLVMASGEYVLFMNQTDIITSVDNLLKAITTAKKLNAQVLLAPKHQRTGINAFSKVSCIKHDNKLLPKNPEEIFSPSDVGAGFLLADIPMPYGNIYQSSYLKEILHTKHSYGNIGDLVISQITLIHANRISIIDIPVIESRYEGKHHPFISSAELYCAEKTLKVQIAITMEEPGAKIIARNLLVLYLSRHISEFHPYNSFLNAVEHYRSICIPLTDITHHDIIPDIFTHWQYLHLLADASPEELIELYSYKLPINE